MRIPTQAALALSALALAAGAVTAGTVASEAQAATPDRKVDATIPSAAPGASPQVAGRAGWQGAFTYSVPTGTTSLFFHYPCATNFVARSGLFDVNGTGQASVKLVGQGPRYDLGYTEWFNTFTFAGGAPAGTQITFDAYCTKTPV